VNTIEMAGMVGAGKTTLACTLRAMLRERDLDALSVHEAIELAMKRSNFGRFSHRLLRAPSHRRTAGLVAYRMLVRPSHEMWFVAHHLRLTRLVLRSVQRLPLPIWHRRKIFRLFLRRAAALEFLGPRLEPREILIVDEGLVQRAVNIFAWSRHEVDPTAVTDYLASVPPSDLVLIVDVPESTSFERASARGLPARLMGHDENTVQRFMMHATDIAAITAGYLEHADRPSCVIENGGSRDRAIESLENVVDDHFAAGKST
jgi:thymidylate kinase